MDDAKKIKAKSEELISIFSPIFLQQIDKALEDHYKSQKDIAEEK